MQWLRKNSVIIFMCISLVSIFLINSESKLADNGIDKKIIANASSELEPLIQEQALNTENKIKRKQTWTDGQIVTHLNYKDPLITLQTLSHLWVYIDDYNKKQKIMAQVSHLAKHSDDRRISGLASLVTGQLVQRNNVVNTTVMSSDEWEVIEQENLVREDGQSESDDEKQDFASDDNDTTDLVNSEHPVLYIDQLLTQKDASDINKFSTLIIDVDEEVSVAAVDALINYLNQGIGNQDEIVGILKENIAFLDDLQIQSVEEILESSNKAKK